MLLPSQNTLLSVLAVASTASASAFVFPAQAVGQAPAITNAPVPYLRPRELDIRQVTATNTQDPEERSDFVGWYQTNSDSAQFCDAGQTWTSSGNYARCCGTSTTCAQTLLCQSQSLMLDQAGVTWTCPSGFSCGTVTVFDEWPKSNARSNFLCANENWSAWTMYRHISTTDSSSAPSTIVSGTTPEGQAGAQSGTSTPGPEHTDSGSSNAWIAGAVIGPIVGIALIAGIAFLLWRRKKAPKPVEAPANYAQPGASNFVMHEHSTEYKPAMPYDGYYNGGSYQGNNGQEWRPSEADSNPVQQFSAPQEMPTDYQPRR